MFPKCKFITREEELQHDGAIARTVMKDFGIRDCHHPVTIRWWKGCKDLVRTKLTSYRNNGIRAMSLCYYSKMQDLSLLFACS